MADELPDPDCSDRDERLITTYELIQNDFGSALDALSDICGINLDPKVIADFCDKHDINSPKQFVGQLIDILMQRLHEKIHTPYVTYFRMPAWIDAIVLRVACDTEIHEKLKKLMPNIPELGIKTPEYEILAYGFLKETVSIQ